MGILTNGIRLVIERAQGEPSEAVHSRVAMQPRYTAVALQRAVLQPIVQLLSVATELADCSIQHVKVEVQLRG
jgi:hypothetical protein